MSTEREVLDRLDRLAIRHYVTGSWALSVHAEPRMTRDLDLVLDLDPADYERRIRPAFDDAYLVNDYIERYATILGVEPLLESVRGG
jgi:hypothetical protein